MSRLGNTAVEVSLAQGRPDASASASSGVIVASNSGRDLPQIRQRKWCGQYAISSIAFDDNTVGAKSLNTLKLRGQLPVWVNLPCSAALPFGAFEAVLQQPRNAEVAAALQKLDAEQHPSPDQLQAVKAALQALQPDAQLQDQVKAAFQQSRKHWRSCYPAVGLQWDGSNPSWQDMWRAITAVWASKWNVRAVSSMRKAGLQHRHLQTAVLCQPVIPAQYTFVAHTTNPITGNEGEIYIELVQGFGGALVGSFPGSALRAVVSKKASHLFHLCTLRAAARIVPITLVFYLSTCWILLVCHASAASEVQDPNYRCTTTLQQTDSRWTQGGTYCFAADHLVVL
ncbi:COP9 signalosome complex subunit 8 [Trebouxia sp. C0009 RCD-2024]